MPRKYAMLSQGRDSINVQVPVTTREFCALHCDLISHNACNNKDRRPIQFLDVKTRPLSLAEVLNTGRRDKRTVKDNFRRGLAFAPGEPYQRFHVKTERPARFALPARRHQVLQIEKPHGLTRGLYEHYFNGMPKVFKWLQDRSGQFNETLHKMSQVNQDWDMFIELAQGLSQLLVDAVPYLEQARKHKRNEFLCPILPIKPEFDWKLESVRGLQKFIYDTMDQDASLPTGILRTIQQLDHAATRAKIPLEYSPEKMLDFHHSWAVHNDSALNPIITTEMADLSERPSSPANLGNDTAMDIDTIPAPAPSSPVITGPAVHVGSNPMLTVESSGDSISPFSSSSPFWDQDTPMTSGSGSSITTPDSVFKAATLFTPDMRATPPTPLTTFSPVTAATPVTPTPLAPPIVRAFRPCVRPGSGPTAPLVKPVFVSPAPVIEPIMEAVTKPAAAVPVAPPVVRAFRPFMKPGSVPAAPVIAPAATVPTAPIVMPVFVPAGPVIQPPAVDPAKLAMQQFDTPFTDLESMVTALKDYNFLGQVKREQARIQGKVSAQGELIRDEEFTLLNASVTRVWDACDQQWFSGPTVGSGASGWTKIMKTLKNFFVQRQAQLAVDRSAKLQDFKTNLVKVVGLITGESQSALDGPGTGTGPSPPGPPLSSGSGSAPGPGSGSGSGSFSTPASGLAPSPSPDNNQPEYNEAEVLKATAQEIATGTGLYSPTAITGRLHLKGLYEHPEFVRQMRAAERELRITVKDGGAVDTLLVAPLRRACEYFLREAEKPWYSWRLVENCVGIHDWQREQELLVTEVLSKLPDIPKYAEVKQLERELQTVKDRIEGISGKPVGPRQIKAPRARRA